MLKEPCQLSTSQEQHWGKWTSLSCIHLIFNLLLPRVLGRKVFWAVSVFVNIFTHSEHLIINTKDYWILCINVGFSYTLCATHKFFNRPSMISSFKFDRGLGRYEREWNVWKGRSQILNYFYQLNVSSGTLQCTAMQS